MTATISQAMQFSGEAFSRWRSAKPFFAVSMVVYLLVPLKYLPGFIAENLNAEAVPSAMVIAAVLLAAAGVFNSIINILFADFLLLISLKIVGFDVIFRDVGPVLRRGFFVFGCGLLCVSAYLLCGVGWDVYTTVFPNIIMGVTVAVHVVELYRSLSVWGISGKGRKAGVVALYCAIPVIVLGAFLLAPHFFAFRSE